MPPRTKPTPTWTPEPTPTPTPTPEPTVTATPLSEVTPAGGQTNGKGETDRTGKNTVTSSSFTEETFHDEVITVTALSASRLYDGTALTQKDVQVSGLPEGYTLQAKVLGSQTDAGESENTVTGYVIYNSRGENVTAFFPPAEIQSGKLTVLPAPITVITRSAEKTYDGLPLAAPGATILGYIGTERDEPWLNTGWMDRSGAETLYVLSGTVHVSVCSPETGEMEETDVSAGERLQLKLIQSNGTWRVQFVIEKVTEDELPDSVLGYLKQHEDFLDVLCREYGWNRKTLTSRMADLKVTSEDAEESLIWDYADVHLPDAVLTDEHADRLLLPTEVRITGSENRPGIRAAATGMQIRPGESTNGYIMDWGNENPSNYAVTEQLGTLRVLPGSTPVPTRVRRPPQAPTPAPPQAPTAVPPQAPTAMPTEVTTPVPAAPPTDVPTAVPTEVPTAVPTEVPTAVPAAVPTVAPGDVPTAVPSLLAPIEDAAPVIPGEPAVAAPDIPPTPTPYGG